MDSEPKFLELVNYGLTRLLDEEKQKEITKPKCFLSKEQIDEHFGVHYRNYIDDLARFKDQISAALASGDPVKYRDVNLSITRSYNAVRLHELYFDSLGQADMPGELDKKIAKSFGSRKRFDKMLKTGLLVARGWVVLGVDHNDELQFCLVDDHDSYIACIRPILALDVWEHAYYIDFKSDRKAYVERLIEDINWEAVGRRL